MLNRMVKHGWRVLALALVLCAPADGLNAGQPAAAAPRRIVSLAPSLTETLFALGAGNEVVGVTEFCTYPPEVRARPRVGGYYDTNLEAVLGLRPDLVVLLPESREQRARLERLGLQTLTVEQHSLAGIYRSYLVLGSATGHEAEAAVLAERFAAACRRVRERTRSLPVQRVLLVLGRDHGAEDLREVYAAGRGELYDELLGLCGCVNAFRAARPKYPKLSAEGVLALDPDLVLELVPTAEGSRGEPALLSAWHRLPGLRAGREGRIRLLIGDELTIPGPRWTEVILKIGRSLRPEAAWDQAR